MSEQNPQVVLETSMGTITVELFREQAPITVKNFLSYVKEGFYDGLIFHRVIKEFMIQGGGLNEELEQKKPRFAIKNEATNGLSNKRGTLAMARTAVVDSATCQFFINVVDNPFLDHQSKQQDSFGYCVFGQVVAGMEVVDEIRAVKTGKVKGHSDVPLEPVFIKTARLVE
ncbi:MAG TPA: peptidylprolyl isomerase [Desulfuromonadaceae bacterium]